MGGVAGSTRSRRIEGWSRAPFGARLPAMFGLAHTGDDFVGIEGALPTMAAMVVVGLVAGVIARRTGSLTIPIAIHLAADIPIYFYWACRVG